MREVLISETVRDRVKRTKIWGHMHCLCSQYKTLENFQKVKIEKHKFACAPIQDTVRDRAKQMKTYWKMFITEMVSKTHLVISYVYKNQLLKYIYWVWMNYSDSIMLLFSSISRYSKDKNIDRARGLFYHGKVRIMLYTERFHFYRR